MVLVRHKDSKETNPKNHWRPSNRDPKTESHTDSIAEPGDCRRFSAAQKTVNQDSFATGEWRTISRTDCKVRSRIKVKYFSGCILCDLDGKDSEHRQSGARKDWLKPLQRKRRQTPRKMRPTKSLGRPGAKDRRQSCESVENELDEAGSPFS